MTWVYLRWLAMTCIHSDWAKICAEGWGNGSSSSFSLPTQVDTSWTHYFLSTGARARLHWNCPELASTRESVWPPIASLCTQVDISKLALTCDSVWRGLYVLLFLLSYWIGCKGGGLRILPSYWIGCRGGTLREDLFNPMSFPSKENPERKSVLYSKKRRNWLIS